MHPSSGLEEIKEKPIENIEEIKQEEEEEEKKEVGEVPPEQCLNDAED